MAFLNDFSAEERLMIISLPYRAGLYVSTSDASGGHDADVHELAALERTIAGIVQGMFESAFVHEVMAETFLEKDEWVHWTKDIKDVPNECHTVIRFLHGRLSQRDIDGYRHILMQIGLEVARAFRESSANAPLIDKIFRQITLVVYRFFGILQREKFVSERILNVSYEEDLALNTLAKALRGDINHVGESVGVITNS
jgi:hypothetical protein